MTATGPQLARGEPFQRVAGLPTPRGAQTLVLLWYHQAGTQSSFRCLQHQQRLYYPDHLPHSHLPAYRQGLVIWKIPELRKGHTKLVNLN